MRFKLDENLSRHLKPTLISLGHDVMTVLFRPRSLGATTVNEFVEAFVRRTDLDALIGCVAVVDSTRLRIRQP